MRKIALTLATVFVLTFLQPSHAAEQNFEFEVLDPPNAQVQKTIALERDSVTVGDRFYFIDAVELEIGFPAEQIRYFDSQGGGVVFSDSDIYDVISLFDLDDRLMMLLYSYEDELFFYGEHFEDKTTVFDEFYLPISSDSPSGIDFDSQIQPDLLGIFTKRDGVAYFAGCDDNSGCGLWRYSSDMSKPELFSLVQNKITYVDSNDRGSEMPVGLSFTSGNPVELELKLFPSGQLASVNLTNGDVTDLGRVESFDYIPTIDFFDPAFSQMGLMFRDATEFEMVAYDRVFDGTNYPYEVVADDQGNPFTSINSIGVSDGSLFFTDTDHQDVFQFDSRILNTFPATSATAVRIAQAGESVGKLRTFGNNDEFIVVSVKEADNDLRWEMFRGDDPINSTVIGTLSAENAQVRGASYNAEAGEMNGNPVIVDDSSGAIDLLAIDLTDLEAQPTLIGTIEDTLAGDQIEFMHEFQGELFITTYPGPFYESGVIAEDGSYSSMASLDGFNDDFWEAEDDGENLMLRFDINTGQGYIVHFDGDQFTQIPASEFGGERAVSLSFYDGLFWVRNLSGDIFVSDGSVQFESASSFLGLDLTSIAGQGRLIDAVDESGVYGSTGNTLFRIFNSAGDYQLETSTSPAGFSPNGSAGFEGSIFSSVGSDDQTSSVLVSDGSMTTYESYGPGTYVLFQDKIFFQAYDSTDYEYSWAYFIDNGQYFSDGELVKLSGAHEMVADRYSLAATDEYLFLGAYATDDYLGPVDIYAFDGENIQSVGNPNFGLVSYPGEFAAFENGIYFADYNLSKGLTVNKLSYPLPQSAPSFSAPAPFQGPVITNAELEGTELVISGNNLELISSVLIGKNELSVTAQGDQLSVDVSDLPQGEYQVGYSYSGSDVKTQFSVNLGEITSESQESAFWTKQVSNSEINLYAKNIVGAGKVQFFHNGNEVAWVRAEDASDSKLRVIESGPMTGANYLVRTRELVEGKNVFEIYVDGERVLRRAQGN